MAGSFLDSLTERYSTLTRSEKKLAGYIFANSTEVQYLSINSLAESSGVSEATITRFCQKMGLLGYNNLKIALAKSDYSFNQRQQVSETMAEHPKTDDALGTISRELFDSYVLSIRETIEQLSPDSFNRAVDLLSNARHVYCFGQGAGMVMAMETSALFSTISRVSIENPQSTCPGTRCSPSQPRMSRVRVSAICIPPSCFLILSSAVVAGR